MRVKELVIDGFKSYAKRTVITNWDTQFNCITGLNGSGKSNILDAICFVLGITTMSTVRAQNQQDLIYKRGQAGVTKASVSIVFDNCNKSKSPLDYKDVDTITVTRQVVLGGTSKYLVNGHRAQQAQVQQLFQEVQLNVNNPNFLIMQGQITKVVNMRPTEILGLIEEAAGTGMYEKERLRAIKEIRDRDAPLHETESLLNEEVRPKLEKLRSQKRQFLEYQQCAASTEALEKVLAVSEYNYHKQRLGIIEKEADERAVRKEELKASISIEAEKCRVLEVRLAELQGQQESQESIRLDAELQSAKEDQARAITELEHKQQQLSTLEAQCQSSTDNINRLLNLLSERESSVEAFESEHALLKSQYEAQHAFLKERRELLTGLQTGISTTGEKEAGYALTTKKARENLASAKSQSIALITEFEKKKALLAKENKQEVNALLGEIESRLVEVNATKAAKEAELERLSEGAKQALELRAAQHKLKDEASRGDRELEKLLSRFPNLDVPDRNPSIKGRVAHIFRVLEEHQSKCLALEVCAGAGIWSLVVNNEKVGAEVLKKARKRMTVLPLNRMRSQVIKRDLVRQIDSTGAWLALDLLGFDEDVRPAIEHVFGRTIICATSAIAERAAFRFGVRSVTLEGDVFDPRGVISGGFQGTGDNANSEGGASAIFNAVRLYQEHVQQSLDISAQLAEIDTQLKTVGQSALTVEQIRNELTLVAHETQLTKFRLEDCRSKMKSISELEGRLFVLTSQLIPLSKQNFTAAEDTLKRALKDSAEFNANKSTKLKELRNEVDAAIKLESQLSNKLETEAAQHSRNQSELARLRADRDQVKKEADSNRIALTELRVDLEDLTGKLLPDLASNIDKLERELKVETSRLSQNRREMQDLEKSVLNLTNKVADMRLSLQKANHADEKQEAALNQAREKMKLVLKRWEWAPEAARVGINQQLQTQSQVPQSLLIQVSRGTSESSEMSLKQLEQLRSHFAQEQRRLQSLASRVDSSVVTMIERLETDEDQLRQRLNTIREDRRKLEESMETLNDRRRETIDKVWRQVSEDFGLIFGDLLPQSSCELIPVGDQPIQNGFIIRVRLGATWKEGLTELSGGQRSLVALALILALLKYHPAPVYILDEVDAALDVHHTRNIGHIIKTRFQNAQFIVVSLKDDMFTNANRIYQTRFVDGTSTVAIMV